VAHDDAAGGEHLLNHTQAQREAEVDDDQGVLQLAVDILEQAGYHVLTAVNGMAAFEMIEQHPYVALLVTDIEMPQLDGLTLADMAKIRRPQLKVLYMTGFSDAAFVRQKAGTLHGSILRKPYRPTQLEAEVHRALTA
jgi:DNA-binding NtrC family response regulator